MHRESNVARWYRRVDPSCFTTQPARYADQEATPALTIDLSDEAVFDRQALRTTAKPVTWLGHVARRLGASGA